MAQLHAMPRMRWLIHAVLPEAGCAAIFGPSTTGKSFLALDVVAAIAECRDWFGHRVKKAGARILMIVLEGEAGFRLRVEAWEKANCRPFPESVRFVLSFFRLNDRTDVLALAAAIDQAGGADLIVIDTLNRATPGADENSSRDMSATLEGCAELQGTTGGLVLLVHHQGKDPTKGMRGHSSLFAAMDAVIEVSRSDDRREWCIAKSKDGSDGQTHAFRLEVVDLGEDEDGETITSCVIRFDDAPVSKRPKPPKGGNQRIVFDALQPLFREAHHIGKAGAPAIRPCIALDDAINGVRGRLTVEPKRRTERARQAITSLVASGVLGLNEGWLWLVRASRTSRHVPIRDAGILELPAHPIRVRENGTEKGASDTDTDTHRQPTNHRCTPSNRHVAKAIARRVPVVYRLPRRSGGEGARKHHKWSSLSGCQRAERNAGDANQRGCYENQPVSQRFHDGARPRKKTKWLVGTPRPSGCRGPTLSKRFVRESW